MISRKIAYNFNDFHVRYYVEIVEIIGYFPSKSVEIIEIYSISDFGTLFFVFLRFQRGRVHVGRGVAFYFVYERQRFLKKVTPLSDIQGFGTDVHETDL